MKISKKSILNFLINNLQVVNKKRNRFKKKKFNKTVLRKKSKEQLLVELSKQNKKLIKKFYKQEGIKGKSKLNKNQLQKDLLSYSINEKTKTYKTSLKKLKSNLAKLGNGTIQDFKINFGQGTGRLDTIKNIMDALPDRQVVMEANGIFYTLNKNNMNRLLNSIKNQEYKTYGGEGSDEQMTEVFNEVKTVNISILAKKDEPMFVDDEEFNFNINPNTETKENGDFFKYTHNTILDLERYGVYKNNSPVKDRNYQENCLIKAFRNYGLDEAIISDIKLECKNRCIPMCKLKKIAEQHNLFISVKKYKNKRDVGCGGHKLKFGTKTEKPIELCLLDDHYFLNEKVPITKYSLHNKNITEEQEEDWNTYYDANKKCKDGSRFILSSKVVKYLYDNQEKYLTIIPISDEMFETQYHNKLKKLDIKSLKYKEDKNAIIYKYKKDDKEPKRMLKIFFDFESCPMGEKHTAFMVRCKHDDIHKGFYGWDCAKQFLNYISKLGYSDVMLIAHNITYDYRFLSPHLFGDNLIEKGTTLMCGQAKFHNFLTKTTINIKLKDSYKLITMPLRDFGSCFKLAQHKDMMPYDIYTIDNVNKQFVKLSEVMKSRFLKIKTSKKYSRGNKAIKEAIEIFNENIVKWKCMKYINDIPHVDIIKYANIYCKIDIIVLEAGYEKFRGWFLDDPFNLDIDNIVSISSLAQKYMEKEGCYDRVSKLSGVPRTFIQRCLVGGRTMMCKNKKQHKVGRIADFDARSLYPSALYRLGGLLQGKPKVIQKALLKIVDNGINPLEKYDGYFIKIKILENGNELDYPLMSYIDEKTGVRNFTNDMKNNIMYVDKIAMEDLIEFQGIKKYEILQGYYFNEGRNPTSTKTIKFLYDERKKKKAEKNPVQVCYKLLMNSIYGKTIQKAIDKDSVIKKDWNETKHYVYRNYNSVVDFYKIHDSKKWKVESLKAIDEHFTFNPVGIEILSMSKRIMNEVFYLAQQEKIKIYIQDTDSLHMDMSNIKRLCLAYAMKYPKRKYHLIGSDMGQFHSDFEMKGCKDVYSEELIALGKKCYLDSLVGIDEKTGEIKRDFHLRMKGSPNQTLFHTADTYLEGDILEMYKYLYEDRHIMINGEKHHGLLFDLLCPDEDNISQRNQFVFKRDYTIGNAEKFQRLLRFK